MEDTESRVSLQENIGMQCKAVGSPYVSQNAAESLSRGSEISCTHVEHALHE